VHRRQAAADCGECTQRARGQRGRPIRDTAVGLDTKKISLLTGAGRECHYVWERQHEGVSEEMSRESVNVDQT
jgi:hypothetical protein